MRHHFKNLKIWQVGIDLVVLIYSITRSIPKEDNHNKVMPVLAELEKMIIGFINKVNQDQKNKQLSKV
jgi:hypothetical protein